MAGGDGGPGQGDEQFIRLRLLDLNIAPAQMRAAGTMRDGMCMSITQFEDHWRFLASGRRYQRQGQNGQKPFHA